MRKEPTSHCYRLPIRSFSFVYREVFSYILPRITYISPSNRFSLKQIADLFFRLYLRNVALLAAIYKNIFGLNFQRLPISFFINEGPISHLEISPFCLHFNLRQYETVGTKRLVRLRRNLCMRLACHQRLEGRLILQINNHSNHITRAC